MSKQSNDHMTVLKKAFLILLVLDIIGSIRAVIALLPTFRQMSEFGQPMMGIFSAMTAVMVAIQLYEILAKFFLMKRISPASSRTAGRKDYITAAKFLFLFNFGALIINLLSAGGAGATPINQGILYLQVLASAAEIIAVFFYLRIVKKA